jgi:hypothetical protein
MPALVNPDQVPTAALEPDKRLAPGANTYQCMLTAFLNLQLEAEFCCGMGCTAFKPSRHEPRSYLAHHVL